jgi:hypothetical protein
MADDIKINTPGNPAAGSANPAQADQLNPVIDLRNIDSPGTAAAGGFGTQAAGQAGQTSQTAGVTAGAAPAQAAPSTRRANAIMLGEEDEPAPVQPKEKYAVPPLVQEKFPDLIQLIKETESMNDEERDYWFQILPIMTEDQIKKFREILVNEKQQLTSLDKEYEQELQKLNDKHMIEWKEFETKEKRKTLTSAENVSKQKEQEEQEALLKRLSQV